MNLITKKKAPRSRAKKRDPERARREIVVAARAEFAKVGYDGARVDRVAETAGISKGLLYHYFASKDELFIAVLEDCYLELRTQNEELIIDSVEPEEGIRQLIAHTYRYFAEHPEFIVLVNSENMMEAEHLRHSSAVGKMYEPLSVRLGELVDAGVAKGIFRADADIIELYISIVGLGYFFLSNRWTLSIVFGQDLLAEGAEERRLQHIVDVVLGYLRHPHPTVSEP